MATLVGDNPSGIQFDDPGPGAGLKAPGVPKVDKIAQVAAKAKAIPATKMAPVKASVKVTVKTGKRHTLLTIEDYKATAIDDEIYNKGGVILFVTVSARTQNAHDYIVEFPA